MNYFELINKCLTELNYRNVNSFSELVKNEHKKIKNILNVLNSEICFSSNWNFLVKTVEVELPQFQGSIENPIDGKILSLKVDGVPCKLIPDFESFFTNSQPANTYSVLNGTILLPQFSKEVKVEILYLSRNVVKDAQGNEKSKFEDAEDESFIPMPFVEPLLVYGTCMRLKGNPQHIRFSFWLSMYTNALANLRAYCKSSDEDVPKMRLKRD